MKKIFTIIFALALLSLMLTSCDIIGGSLGDNDSGSNTEATTDALKDVASLDKTETYDEIEKDVFAANAQSGVPTVYEGS